MDKYLDIALNLLAVLFLTTLFIGLIRLEGTMTNSINIVYQDVFEVILHYIAVYLSIDILRNSFVKYFK